MKYRNNLIGGIAAVALSGCAAADEPRVAAVGVAVAQSDEPASVIGAPYTIDGVIYTPAEVRSYDEVGYAIIDQAVPADGTTMLGEPYRGDYIAAAHKTLPLPSYVEITDIASGRTILARVNQRGPMRGDRIVSLTPGAAAQLGIGDDAPAGVRVRKVNPSQSERDVLRSGGMAIERMPTSKSLLSVLARKLAERGPVPVAAKPVDSIESAPAKAKPVAVQPAPPAKSAPAPTESVGQYYVQIAAFKSRASADGVAAKAGATVYQGPGVWRVRFGPFASDAEARKALADARAKGYPSAVTVHER